jgi:hypothetical protein
MTIERFCALPRSDASGHERAQCIIRLAVEIGLFTACLATTHILRM